MAGDKGRDIRCVGLQRPQAVQVFLVAIKVYGNWGCDLELLMIFEFWKLQNWYNEQAFACVSLGLLLAGTLAWWFWDQTYQTMQLFLGSSS
jgi:hypothetical protein